jgi:mevalonate kinase
MMHDGGGGAPKITVDPEEITTIHNQLQNIISELASKVEPNIMKLGELNFYTAGKAKEAMDAYADANEKIMELYDNYVRASTLVIDTLVKMVETDEEIAKQIFEKLEG